MTNDITMLRLCIELVLRIYFIQMNNIKYTPKTLYVHVYLKRPRLVLVAPSIGQLCLITKLTKTPN